MTSAIFFGCKALRAFPTQKLVRFLVDPFKDLKARELKVSLMMMNSMSVFSSYTVVVLAV